MNGPVVEGLGLCSCMLPPRKNRVEITTACAPVNGALMPVSSIPNLSGPFGPEPGSATSKVLARKYTSPKRFVRAVPQISGYLDFGKGSTYAVIVSLLTCNPAHIRVVSWSRKFT